MNRFSSEFQLSIYAGAFLVLGHLAGCGPGAATAKREAPVPVVVPIHCIEMETVDFAEFIGRTDAYKTVEVRARVSGFIKQVLFTDGAEVKKDQVLFKIESEQYQAVLAQADSRIALLDAQLELANTKLARAKKLIDANAISREEYDENIAAVKEANASIAAARADREIALLDVNYTDVKAEMDGRIDRALITEGNVVSGGLFNGTLLTRIVENNPMYVFFDVDERSLLNYQRLLAVRDPSNQEPKIADNAYPCYIQLQDESTFNRKGTLNFIENRADAATGTIRVRAQFENHDNVLTGGLFVRIRIPKQLQPYKAIVVPEQAIITDQTAKSVLVVGTDKKVEKRSISIGEQKGQLRVVADGLKPGEMIVLDGIQKVRVNEAVELKAGWETAEAAFYDKAKASQPQLDSAPVSTELPATSELPAAGSTSTTGTPDAPASAAPPTSSTN